MILKFIEQGTTVIDAKVDYFREEIEIAKYSYKNQFIKQVRNTFVKIISYFKQILFCM